MQEKPTADTIINGERLKAFPSRSGTTQGCPYLPLLLNIILEILVCFFFFREIRQEKEKKASKLGSKN